MMITTDEFWSIRDAGQGANAIIVGKSNEPVLTSTYCLTKQHYTDFRMTCQVKLQESEMHSGISFWGHVPPPQHGEDHTYAGHLVMFPSSKIVILSRFVAVRLANPKSITISGHPADRPSQCRVCG